MELTRRIARQHPVTVAGMAKTYWHLAEAKRIPKPYDLLTSKLLYYVDRGLETDLPLQSWYDRYQKQAMWQHPAWDRFADPHETTYGSYVERQKKREIFVDGLLHSITERHYDWELSDEWLALLETVVGVLRFPGHGLQMAAAYIGQMAPTGRLTVLAAFQAADEMRRIQRFAYRMRQLQERMPHFGANTKQYWQVRPEWQPLRALIERLLITYDWSDAFIALNLVIKPLYDTFFLRHFATWSRTQNDPLFAEILDALFEDAAWHHGAATALACFATQGTEPHAIANGEHIATCIKAWEAPTLEALHTCHRSFEISTARFPVSFDEIRSAYQEFKQKELGL